MTKKFTAKFPYEKKSHGEVSLRRKALTVNCIQFEVSSRRKLLRCSALTAKYPTVNCTTAKSPAVKIPFTYSWTHVSKSFIERDASYRHYLTIKIGHLLINSKAWVPVQDARGKFYCTNSHLINCPSSIPGKNACHHNFLGSMECIRLCLNGSGCP